MQVLALVVALAIFCALASATVGKSGTVYPTPMPTFEAKEYTKWDVRRVNGSKRANIYIPVDDQGDYVSMTRLDLVGDAKARGFAHGALLAKEIVEFTGPKLDKYYMDALLDIDVSNFPEPLQKILNVLKVKGAIAAPQIAREAMDWVWNKEESYVPQNLIDEMEGIAEGMCSVLGSKCDVAEWSAKIKSVNMLPELIRMACTAYGAYDSATPTNTLVQIRALDFGAGPFANYTIVSVNRNDPTNDNAFVSITFPGFVGAITGVSQHGIGISEKVWMTYDTPDLQPGSYDGEADVFVLRDILEKAKNRADAEKYVANARRTWAIWIGVGDYETKKFDLVGYKQDSAVVYNDETAPQMTGQPYIKNVVYVDKHPQPSGEGPTGSLPTALQDFWGDISLETSKTILMYHRTGDVHIASYDYGAKEMYVAIGKIDQNGKYGPDNSMWEAHNRPYVKFSLPDLWLGR